MGNSGRTAAGPARTQHWGSLRRTVEDLPGRALQDLAQLLGVLGELGVAHQLEERAISALDLLLELGDLREQRIDLVDRRTHAIDRLVDSLEGLRALGVEAPLHGPQA